MPHLGGTLRDLLKEDGKNRGVTLRPPVSFNPVPPTVTLNPVARNPLCGVVRIMNVVARNPDVGVSVPFPVTRIPNVTVTWRRWCRLNSDWWRSSPHNDLLCPGVRWNGQCASGK